MIPLWIANEPAREHTPEEERAIVDAIAERRDRARRELATAIKINYCRHQDSPAWRQKVEEIFERHPEWRNPDANWWD